MNILGVIGNILGIGKNALENRAKRKLLKQEQEHQIISAETDALVHRIKTQTESDNTIDEITARNKKYTWKDEFVTYLFLIPVLVATITPFIITYNNSDWEGMNKYIVESYLSLNSMPDWYSYVLAAIIVDVLGMRSFMRKLFDKYVEKKYGKDDTGNK